MDSCNASNSAAIIKILCEFRYPLRTLKRFVIDCFSHAVVESNCDEKKSSYILEDATSELRKFHIYCTFTVVCNGFVALECFEHTKYDMLIVDRVSPNLKIICAASLLELKLLILAVNLFLDTYWI